VDCGDTVSTEACLLVHIHAHTRTHIYIHTYRYIHTDTYIHTYIHTYTHTHTHTHRMHKRTHTCVLKIALDETVKGCSSLHVFPSQTSHTEKQEWEANGDTGTNTHLCWRAMDSRTAYYRSKCIPSLAVIRRPLFTAENGYKFPNKGPKC
jgi:hypothetical protein